MTTVLFDCTSDNQRSKDKDEQEERIKGEIPIRYQFSSKIRGQIKSIGNQGAAFLFANIGQHFDALQSFDRDFPEVNATVFYDSTNFSFYPAIEYISQQAKQYQIVIINEAHHVSSHRFFTRLLLQKLKKNGFNYFGAETLIETDTLLTNRGYPILNSGYFTPEPQFGNLVREAIASGFKVFAYEASSEANGMQREIEQARNIEKLLKSDPEARILLHCGYAHLTEDEVQGWGKAMAGRLTEYTGIDPLTIDQVELTEHSEAKYENPYFRKMTFDDYVVPVNNGKMITGGFRLNGHHSDLFVYHPRTQILYNRPNWLFRLYKPFIVNNKITVDYPVIVKAYYSDEDETQAIPVDVIEITKNTDTTALALLSHRTYKIIVESENGQAETFDIDF